MPQILGTVNFESAEAGAVASDLRGTKLMRNEMSSNDLPEDYILDQDL